MFFPHLPLYSKTEIGMLGQLDMVRHPDVSLGLLLVMTIAVARATADDITLMTAVGVGIALVVVFAELQIGKYLPRSLRL